MIQYSGNLRKDICIANNLPESAISRNTTLYRNPRQAELREFFEWNQDIVVFSDCDTDGLCAAAICKIYFEKHLFGHDVNFVTSSRSERGFTIDSIKNIKKMFPKTTGILTVDCGIGAVDAVNYAIELGMDVVITDHHNPDSVIPSTVIINPKLDNYQDFNEFCGAGLIYLCLSEIFGDNELAIQYAAIATVADMVPLLYENRLIVQQGLKLINANYKQPSPINSLTKALGITLHTEKDIGWGFAPAINAASRLNQEIVGLNAVVHNQQAAMDYLKGLNGRRKDIVKKTYEDGKEKAQVSESGVSMEIETPFDGLAGLIAAKLSSEFGLVSLAYCKTNDEGYHFSMRGADWPIVITEFINSLDSKFSVSGGGHDAAGGFSAKCDQIGLQEIVLAFHKWCDTTRPADDEVKAKINYDIIIPFDEALNSVNAIEGLRPFGMGFQEPVFYSENVDIVLDGTTTSGYNRYKLNSGDKSATFYDYKNILNGVKKTTRNITYRISYNKLLKQIDANITGLVRS